MVGKQKPYKLEYAIANVETGSTINLRASGSKINLKACSVSVRKRTEYFLCPYQENAYYCMGAIPNILAPLIISICSMSSKQ